MSLTLKNHLQLSDVRDTLRETFSLGLLGPHGRQERRVDRKIVTFFR